jgi:glucokinase
MKMRERGGERVIAVDVGGGSVKLALTDAGGEALASDIIDGVSQLGREALLGELTRRAEALLATARAKGETVRGAAIGVPGHLSADRRASLNSNVPVLDGVDLVGHFEERLGCAVELENDANLAAIGEWRFGPWRSAARFMMVTLGTGIGVALLEHGTPVGLVGGTLGDAGHVIVDPSAARSCRLGCRGCLESVASGVALGEIAGEAALRSPDSPLGQLARGGREISGADLARLATAGDEASLAILTDAARWLGTGLATYINVFAPDVICIGGGMSRLQPFLEADLVRTAEATRIKNRPGPAAIYFSPDHHLAAGRGAAALFFQGGNQRV